MRFRIVFLTVILSICSTLCWGQSPCQQPYAGGPSGPITWILCLEGTLTISGNGNIPDYLPLSGFRHPWWNYRYYFSIAEITPTITGIGAWAFYDCATLGTIVIPEKVASIGTGAFSHCAGLSSIMIPANVRTIGDNAFHNCLRLENVTVYWKNANELPTIGNNVFTGIVNSAVLHVPAGTKALYQAHPVWGAFRTIKEDGVVSNALSVSPSSLNFAASGEQKTFAITSNTSWTVSSSNSWLTVTPASGNNNGTVVVAAAANTATSHRSATITVSGTGVDVKTINVTQEAAAPIPTLSVSPTSLNFAATGEQKTFTVTSNTGWVVNSSDSWLTVTPVSGSNNGTVVVMAAANTATSQRSTTITVSGTGVNVKTINVAQEAAAPIPTLSVSPSSLNFAATGEQKTFTVTSNTGWTINSSESWLTVTPVSGSNNGTVVVTAVANTATSQRSAIISVSGTGVTTQAINITQSGGQGSGGSNGEWKLSSTMTATLNNGVLTIRTTSTSEAMRSFYCSGAVMPCHAAAPWPRNDILSVVIEGKITSIGDYAFDGCSNLSSVIVGTSVQIIGKSAFNRCANLSFVRFSSPNSVTTIDGGAFRYCTALTSIEIPGSVVTIGVEAFAFCSNLTTVTTGDSISLLKTIGSAAFMNCNSLTSITIPNSVEEIGPNAFSSCTSLTSAEIPASVSMIRDRTFSECYNLTSVTIPNSVISIGQYAFYCCGLTSISIPNSVKSIGLSAFAVCGLTSLTIPSSVTMLDREAFSGCTGLKEVTVIWTTPLPVRGVFRFVNTSACTLRVPFGTSALYRSAVDWGDFGTIIEDAPIVIPEETQPISQNGSGNIGLSLSVPSDATLTGSFNIQFPEGISLDEELTVLSPELAANFNLSFSNQESNTWLVEIKSKELRSASASDYRQIMTIAYKVNGKVSKGSYEVTIANLDFILNNGTSIKQDMLLVTVSVLQNVAVENIHHSSFYAFLTGNMLTVESPHAEFVTVYSVLGIPICTVKKNAGRVEIPVSRQPGSILLVRGSVSGTIKAVRNLIIK